MDTTREGRRPTLHDVAALAGVSIKTVSRVVNEVSTVDEGIASRVREAVAQLGYRPNQLASRLRSGAPTATIGLVLKDISNEFYSSITLGVASAARARSTQLITAASDEDIDSAEELDLIFDLCRRRVDGMIVIPRGGDYSALRPEIEMGTPMVFLDRHPEELAVDSVLLDNAGGSRAAIDRLIEQGHRRIGLIFHELELEPIGERLRGVRDALDDAGVADDPELLVTGLRDPQSAREAAARMLDLDDPPTAIFCAYNRLTEGVVTAVWERGAPTVVAGFDDFRFSALVPVPLVLVAYDAQRYGRTAADVLFDRIGGDRSPARRIVVPTTIVETGLRATVRP
ncbi:LacI family DNA-binding transcriptional regulator [Schumannella luteola]